jgi:hypothetical protein
MMPRRRTTRLNDVHLLIENIKPEKPIVPESVGFWMNYNYAYSNYNIKLLLSTLGNICLIGSIGIYSEYGDVNVLLVPLAYEVLTNLIAVRYQTAYSVFFALQNPLNLRRMWRTELYIITVKLILSAICFWSRRYHSPWLGWLAVGFSLFLLFVINMIDYTTCYDQAFLFTNLTTLVLFLVKHHGISDLSWSMVFMSQRILGWILLLVSSLLVAVWALIILLWLLCQIKVAFKQILYQLVLISVLSCKATVYYQIERHFLKSEYVFGVSFYNTCRLYCALNVVYFLLTLCFQDGNRAAEKEQARTRQTSLKQKNNIDDFLKVILSAPTFFINQSTVKPLRSFVEEVPVDVTEEDCLLCYENTANCLMHPCLHSGICRKCGQSIMRSTARCLLCKQETNRILVVEKINDQSKYLITEEILPLKHDIQADPAML